MDKHEIQERAEELTKKAEAGDKNGLSQELNNMSIEDRLAVAHEMKRINEQHNAKNPDLPNMEISITKDAGGREHLADIKMNPEKAWYNPLTWFKGSTDVYDPPHSNLGSGLLQSAADGIRDRRRLEAELFSKNK